MSSNTTVNINPDTTATPTPSIQVQIAISMSKGFKPEGWDAPTLIAEVQKPKKSAGTSAKEEKHKKPSSSKKGFVLGTTPPTPPSLLPYPSLSLYVCVRACMHACVCMCARACVCVCVCQVQDCQKMAGAESSRGAAALFVTQNQQRALRKKGARGGEGRDSLTQVQGLASVCSRVLGVELEKTQQCSNWDRRPLKARQLQYAALDAHVLIQLYHVLLAPTLPCQ
jgi:hypothetical protein